MRPGHPARPFLRKRASAASRLLVLATGLYAACALAVPAVLGRLGDHWWPTTVFMFGPRWVVALPLVLLLLAALFLRPRLLPWLLALGALVGVLVLGFNLPWRRLAAPAPAAPAFRLLTWNVGGGGQERALASPAFLASARGVDVVVLQECRPSDREGLPGWHTHFDAGQCLMSRLPLARTDDRPRGDMWKLGGSGAIVSYEIEAPGGRFSLTNVHLETPREGLDALRYQGALGSGELERKNAQRRLEARLAREWVDTGPPLPRIVAGDFNMTCDSAVFREAWGDLTDAFSAAGFGFGHTKTTRFIGVRIDHVLVDRSWRVQSAEVEPKDPGHDHQALVVELARISAE